ncbi:hypothetical protein ACWGOQ_0004805 [Aquimarina sp. M1]
MPPEKAPKELKPKNNNAQESEVLVAEEAGEGKETASFQDNREQNKVTLQIKKGIENGKKNSRFKFSSFVGRNKTKQNKEDAPYFYTWDEKEKKFTPSNKKVIDGSEIVFATKVTSNKDFARIGIKNEEEHFKFGYVRIADFSNTNLWPWSFGETGLLKPINNEELENSKTYHKANHDWYLNFAILYDTYKSLDKIVEGKDQVKAQKAKETQHRIALTILQNYAKTAGEGGATNSRGKQITAFNEGHYYHRNDGGGLTSKINELLKDKIKIDNPIRVISDPFVREAIARNFPVLYTEESANLEEVNTTIDSIDSFKASMKNLCNNHANNFVLKDDFVFNFTKYYENIKNNNNSEQEAIVEIQERIAEAIEKSIEENSYVKENLYKDVKYKKELIDEVVKKIKYVIVTEYEGIHYLVVLKPIFKEKELYKEISPDIGSIKWMLNHSGMVIDPLSAKEALLKLSSLEEVLQGNTNENGSKATLPLLTLATKNSSKGSKPKTAEDTTKKVAPFTFNDFLKHTVLKKFKALEEEKDTLPYVQIYVPATIDLLNGLKEKINIDKEFAERGISNLLKASCFRMLLAMTDAIRFSDNMVRFLNHIEVIHNQIQMILAITEPYEQNEDFTEAIQGILTGFYMPEVDEEEEKVVVDKEKKIEETQPEKTQPEKKPKRRGPKFFRQLDLKLFSSFFKPKKEKPKDIPNENNLIVVESLPKEKPVKKQKITLGNLLKQAEIQHKASAMHATSSALAAAEKEKGTNRLNVLLLEGNYYEAVGYVEDKAKKDLGLVKEAKTYKVSVLKGKKLDKVGASLDEAIDGEVKEKFDVFLCDFHHNISTTLQEYKTENLIAHVRKLFEEDKVAPRFTVAIDSTIDFIRSNDIKEFLAAFEGEITSGKLNVVIYRSAQKFDMLGLDNYYGGYSITINNRESYKEFNERISDLQDNVQGLAHQGLTHLNTHASDHLDDYRRAIIKNNKMFYDKLMDAGLGEEAKDHFYIVKNSDPNMVFIHVGGAYADRMCKRLLSEFKSVTARSSFGFATTNYSFIPGDRARITVGLDSEETIDQYVDCFELWHKIGKEFEFYLKYKEKVHKEYSTRKEARAKKASISRLSFGKVFSIKDLSDYRIGQILTMLRGEMKYKVRHIEEKDKRIIEKAITYGDKEVLKTYKIERCKKGFIIRKISDKHLIDKHTPKTSKEPANNPNDEKVLEIHRYPEDFDIIGEFYVSEETENSDSISESELDKNDVFTSKEHKKIDKTTTSEPKELDNLKNNNANGKEEIKDLVEKPLTNKQIAKKIKAYLNSANKIKGLSEKDKEMIQKVLNEPLSPEKEDNKQDSIAKEDAIKRKNRIAYIQEENWMIKDYGAGGDCLFLAMNKSKNTKAAFELRKRITDYQKEHGLIKQGVVDAELTQMLRSSSNPDIKGLSNLAEKRENIPLDAYYLVAALPGIWAGRSEISAYTLMENKSVVYVIESEGLITEYKNGKGNSNIDRLPDHVFNDPNTMVLYKTPNHWQRVEGIKKGKGSDTYESLTTESIPQSSKDLSNVKTPQIRDYDIKYIEDELRKELRKEESNVSVGNLDVKKIIQSLKLKNFEENYEIAWTGNDRAGKPQYHIERK